MQMKVASHLQPKNPFFKKQRYISNLFQFSYFPIQLSKLFCFASACNCQVEINNLAVYKKMFILPLTDKVEPN